MYKIKKFFLTRNQVTDIIKESAKMFELNRKIDLRQFTTAFYLVKWLKEKYSFDYIYFNLVPVNDYVYKLKLEDEKDEEYKIYTMYLDMDSEEFQSEYLSILEKMLHENGINSEKRKIIFLTDYEIKKKVVDDKINTKIEIVDYEVIFRKILKLKSIVDELVLDYESYKKHGISKADNVSLGFCDLKSLIYNNRTYIKNKELFGYNLRFSLKEQNKIIQQISQELIKRPENIKVNNGLTIGYTKLIVDDKKKMVVLKNASVLNGQQNIVSAERLYDELSPDIKISFKLINYSKKGMLYLDKVAKITNSQNKVKNKEMNSNADYYHYLNKAMRDEAVNNKFRAQLIFKEGQVIEKGIKKITKQEALSLLKSFKDDEYDFDSFSKEKTVFKTATPIEILSLNVIKHEIITYSRPKLDFEVIEVLNNNLNEERVKHYIYYMFTKVLRYKQIINSEEKQRLFIENFYRKYSNEESFEEIIGKEILKTTLYAVDRYFEDIYQNKTVGNDKFRRAMGDDEILKFKKYIKSAEKFID